MERSLDIEEEINNFLDEDTKSLAQKINKNIFRTELKAFKLDEFSIAKYSLPSFDFTKITKSEFNKLYLLIQNQKEYVELMKGFIKHGGILNKCLSNSLNYVGGIKHNLCGNSSYGLYNDVDLFLSSLHQKLNDIHKSLKDMNINSSERLEGINKKKKQLINFQFRLENQNEAYTRRMQCCLKKKFKAGKFKEEEIFLPQDVVFHKLSAYDVVCKNFEKELNTKLQNYDLLKQNFKFVVEGKLKKKYGITFENFKSFSETKIGLMTLETANFSLKFKHCLRELVTEKEHNLERLSREINLLENKVFNTNVNIESMSEEIIMLQKKEKTLSHMTTKFKKFLEVLDSENKKIMSLKTGMSLFDLSNGTCYSQNTAFSMVYLNMLNELSKM